MHALLSDDSLAAALADNRVYVLDLTMLSSLVSNIHSPQGAKYTFAPKAMFVRARGQSFLLPVAIQCGQDPVRHPVIAPGDGAWMRAKSILNGADATCQQLQSHLACTHFLMEAVALATHHSLPACHVVRHLLEPHYEGTQNINSLAAQKMLRPGQFTDLIHGATLESMLELIAASVASYDFNAAMLPADLARRRVLDAELEYPYRDDALLLWQALHAWVQEVLGMHYADDAAVQHDEALQAWAAELAAQDGARVRTFGEPGRPGVVSTRAWLVDAVTHIIFTASAQHAAVNFSSEDYVIYEPAMPLALYTDAPTSIDTPEQAEADVLCSLDIALQQATLICTLSRTRYTRLGHYRQHEVARLGAESALAELHAALESIEATIVQRNTTRALKYEYLLPSLIPQSTNI